MTAGNVHWSEYAELVGVVTTRLGVLAFTMTCEAFSGCVKSKFKELAEPPMEAEPNKTSWSKPDIFGWVPQKTVKGEAKLAASPAGKVPVAVPPGVVSVT